MIEEFAMTEKPDRPRIRPGLDFFPVEHEGRRMICLRDPLEIAPDSILVTPEAFFLIAHMDGDHSILDIQAAFTRRFGRLVMGDQVHALAHDLAERGFLDDNGFHRRLAAAETAFRASPIRRSSHAGQAYPDTADETRDFLDRLFESCPNEPEGAPSLPAGPLAGIIAPHIDLHRGGALFARAYAALRNTPPPASVLLLGTAHFSVEGGPYILTDKGFETPLGLAATDADFCRHLTESCPFDLHRGELAHRTEHSIEFQVLLLQYIYGPERMPPIVPVLCTSLMERIETESPPSTLPEVTAFIQAVRTEMEHRTGAVLVVAGADMSHVGRKFATPDPLSPDYLDRVRREDGQALQAAEALDGEGFFHAVRRIGNRNNICSVTSIYTLLEVLGEGEGRLLGYDLSVDEASDAAVGFAALNFWRT